MKHILSLVLLLCLWGTVSAQGNLQFNQALLVEHVFTITPNVSYPYTEQAITVPVGKVWKIESVMATYLLNSSGNNPGYATNVVVTLNKKILYHGGVVAVFPIWLPEGSYTLRYAYSSNTSSSINEVYGAISVIEFNITP